MIMSLKIQTNIFIFPDTRKVFALKMTKSRPSFPVSRDLFVYLSTENNKSISLWQQLRYQCLAL